MDNSLLIQVSRLTKEYARKGRFGRTASIVRALDSVDLKIPAGARTGISGPSGSGKSTLARCLAGWEIPSSGAIETRAPVQLVIQDPGSSLNPRFTARGAIEEPFRIRRQKSEGVAARLLESVGIDASWANKRVAQFSGGERARIAIARALAAMGNSRGVIIFDESFSNLDADTRAPLIALLLGLQQERGLAYVIISHETDWMEGIATERIFMRGGRVVG